MEVKKTSCCSTSRNTESGKEGVFNIGQQERQHETSSEVNNRPSRDGMVYLEGGEFLMGTDGKSGGFASDGEGPIHKVKLKPFYIDQTTVTNASFAEFVKETGYKTDSEKYGWSFVFRLFLSPVEQAKVAQVVQSTPWWAPIEGAFWYSPEGPDTHIKDRMDHPVVHISWNDAAAYCQWAGKRLPTEAEWEYAARGGLEGKVYAWGDELTPGGKHYCNIWQGLFPEKNTKRDGYVGTAPARSFPPNGYGLYNVAGNVWEWTNDWFDKNYYSNSPLENPQGPESGTSRSMRGGSYLCHKSYCNRYRVAARSSNTPDSAAGNIGFRCAADV